MRTDLRIVIFGLLVACGVAGAVLLKLQGVPEPIVIETPHIDDLKPHEHDPGDAVSDPGHHVEVLGDFIVPYDMAITDIRFEIVNAPSSVLHHAALLDYYCIDEGCTEHGVRELVRHGQDTMHLADGSLPDGFMSPIRKGDRLQLQLMVHNPEPPLGTGKEYHDVYARVTLAQRSHKAAAFRPVHFVHLYVNDNCTPLGTPADKDTFSIPAKTADYVFSGCPGPGDHSHVTISKGGVIVHMGAHLHGWQGGKELDVYRNGTLFHVFHTAVSKDDPYRYDTEYSQELTRVLPGDTFTISAHYENPNSVPTRGAMGMFGFFMADE